MTRRSLIRFTLCSSIVVIIVECLSYLALSTLSGKLLSGSDIEKMGASNLRYIPAKWSHPAPLVHPYVGFLGVGEYDHDLPIPHRSDDKVVILVVGGSVAFLNAEDKLRSELIKLEPVLGKKVEFFNFASGSHKQPQQSMIINYIITLGGSFDVVINIDGVNEVLYPAFNLSVQLPIAFPIKWHVLTDRQTNPLLREIGKKVYMSELREAYRQTFRHFPLRYSPFANLLWVGVDSILKSAEIKQDELILSSRFSRWPKQGLGTYPYSTEEALHKDLATLWHQSSLRLSELAKLDRFKYFHFLQPNLYYPLSKRLSPEEVSFVQRANRLAQPIPLGYPLLQKRGKELKDVGVSFHDLTDVFKDVSSTVYWDDCFHLNNTGNEVLARKIADILAGSLTPKEFLAEAPVEEKNFLRNPHLAARFSKTGAARIGK